MSNTKTVEVDGINHFVLECPDCGAQFGTRVGNTNAIHGGACIACESDMEIVRLDDE